MTTVSFQDWQHDPEALLKRVAGGEHLVVLREGKPVAELHPVSNAPIGTRPFGLCRGDFETPDSFTEPLPDEILRGFEGG